MGPLPFKRELRWIWSSFRGQNFNKWKENKGGQFTIGKILLNYFQFSSVTQSCLTLCDPMDCSTPDFPVHHQFLELAQTQCPSSHWCHRTTSVVPFSSYLPSFPASGSFPMSQFFASGGQSTGVFSLALVLPMDIQDWFPLGLTGLISLQSKGLWRVFSNTTV